MVVWGVGTGVAVGVAVAAAAVAVAVAVAERAGVADGETAGLAPVVEHALAIKHNATAPTTRRIVAAPHIDSSIDG